MAKTPNYMYNNYNLCEFTSKISNILFTHVNEHESYIYYKWTDVQTLIPEL